MEWIVILSLFVAQTVGYSVCPWHVECIPGCLKLDEKGCKMCACGPMMFHPGAGYRGMPGGMVGGASFTPGTLGGGSLFGHAQGHTVTEKPLKECTGTMLCMMTCKGHYSLSKDVKSNGCRTCTCPKESHNSIQVVVVKPTKPPAPQVTSSQVVYVQKPAAHHVTSSQVVYVQKPATHPDCTGTKLCMMTCKGKYILGEHGKDGCQSCACIPEPKPVVVQPVSEKKECHETVLCMLSCKHGYTLSPKCNDGCHDDCQKCSCIEPTPAPVIAVQTTHKVECPKTLECMLRCKDGYHLGSKGVDGCPDCKCLAPQPVQLVYEVKCPQALSCSRGCSVGYKCSKDGCPTCECIQPQVVGVLTVTEIHTTQQVTCKTALTCPKSCSLGYKCGPDGCPTCDCLIQVHTAACTDGCNSHTTGNGNPLTTGSGSSQSAVNGNGHGGNIVGPFAVNSNGKGPFSSGASTGGNGNGAGPFTVSGNGQGPLSVISSGNGAGPFSGNSQGPFSSGVATTNTGNSSSSSYVQQISAGSQYGSSFGGNSANNGRGPFSTLNNGQIPLHQINGGGIGSVSQSSNYNNIGQSGFGSGPFATGSSGISTNGLSTDGNGYGAGVGHLTDGSGGNIDTGIGSSPFSVATGAGITGGGATVGGSGQLPATGSANGITNNGAGPFSSAQTGSGVTANGPFAVLQGNGNSNSGHYASGLGNNWQSGSGNGKGWANGGTSGPFSNGQGSGQTAGQFHNMNGSGYGTSPSNGFVHGQTAGGIGGYLSQTGAVTGNGLGQMGTAPGTNGTGPYSLSPSTGGPASNNSGLPLSPYSVAAGNNGGAGPFASTNGGNGGTNAGTSTFANGMGNGGSNYGHGAGPFASTNGGNGGTNAGTSPFASGMGDGGSSYGHGAGPFASTNGGNVGTNAGTSTFASGMGNGGNSYGHITDGTGGNIDQGIGGYGSTPYLMSGYSGSSNGGRPMTSSTSGQSSTSTSSESGSASSSNSHTSASTGTSGSAQNLLQIIVNCPDTLKCMQTCERGYNLDTPNTQSCPVCTCVGETGDGQTPLPGNLIQESFDEESNNATVKDLPVLCYTDSNFMCLEKCANGYKSDKSGCPTCDCIGQSAANSSAIKLICEEEFNCAKSCYGYMSGKDGCPICECISVTSLKPIAVHATAAPVLNPQVSTLINKCPDCIKCMSTCEHGYTLGPEGPDGCPSCSCINPVKNECHDVCQTKPALTVHTCDAALQCMASCTDGYTLGETGSDGCPRCACKKVTCNTGCEETHHQIVQLVQTTGSSSSSSGITSGGGGGGGGGGGAMMMGGGGGMIGGGDQCKPLPPNCHPYCIKYDVAHCRICTCESRSNGAYSG